MVDKLTKEELEEYREAFSFYDGDRDGKISSQEVVTVIRACGQAPSQKQAAALISEIGANARLNFNEFITIATRNIVKSPTSDEIMESFKVLDKDGSGLIPSVELKHTMTNLGEKFGDLEVEYMLLEAGVDADGQVNYETFVKEMSKFH
eukprot:TRINITY_DN1353_c0_g1_i1.p1 TRINITY_DN1353_c0_g1~~TRINITY_DN1353_c0_g1_i1.p1  ORF type:complete len:162 (-),score=80.53 TRINITY_DN1353_c0_g1_i1:111-557(-)